MARSDPPGDTGRVELPLVGQHISGALDTGAVPRRTKAETTTGKMSSRLLLRQFRDMDTSHSICIAETVQCSCGVSPETPRHVCRACAR